MQITKASLDAIFWQFDLRFKQAYQEQPIFWDQYATLAPSAARETHYGWIGKIPRLREWIGERQFNNLASRGYVIVNKKYEDSIRVKREDIEDDQIGVYQGYVDALGQQSRLWPEDVLTSVLETGLTATAFDGQPFFHNSHPVDVDNPGLGTYQNRWDVNALGGGISRPLNAANYQFVRAQMMKIKGEDNRSLNVIGDVLMVPPLLEATAKQILEADYIAQAVGGNVAQMQTNVLKGSARIVVNPYLTSDTAWYLFCTKRAIKPLIWQLRDAPQFVYKNNPTDDNAFYRDEYDFGVRARGNAGFALPFLAARGDV